MEFHCSRLQLQGCEYDGRIMEKVGARQASAARGMVPASARLSGNVHDHIRIRKSCTGSRAELGLHRKQCSSSNSLPCLDKYRMSTMWYKRRPARRRLDRPILRAKESDSDEEEPLTKKSFWEGEEGKRKLRDIEEMKELMNEAQAMEEELMREQKGVDAEGNTEGKSAEELARERAEKLREELARKAMAQVERRKQAEAMFQLGQQAYGRGVYDRSVEIFEAALSKIEKNSNLGGEIQIWLAMAYDAHNRRGDCIALYRQLEAAHPNKMIRRQAADLRYIAEAPKLKLSKEEMVSIPLLDRDSNSTTRTWSEMVKDRKPRPVKKGPKQRDYMDDLMMWKPPRWERSPYFWVALSVWLTAVGISLMFQN